MKTITDADQIRLKTFGAQLAENFMTTSFARNQIDIESIQNTLEIPNSGLSEEEIDAEACDEAYEYLVQCETAMKEAFIEELKKQWSIS